MPSVNSNKRYRIVKRVDVDFLAQVIFESLYYVPFLSFVQLKRFILK